MPVYQESSIIETKLNTTICFFIILNILNKIVVFHVSVMVHTLRTRHYFFNTLKNYA